MAISPDSPTAYTSSRSAATDRTVPSPRRTFSVPPRSVNSIVPSGAKARSQGMVSPDTSVVTAMVGASPPPPPSASRTSDVALAEEESLVPARASVPAPRTVTVRLTRWLVSAPTEGRVQVGCAEAGSSSVPPPTLQRYSGLPS